MRGGASVYTLKLMGAFRLTEPSGQRIEITSRKGMALIAMLATADDGERARAWLQDRLWGSRQPDQARNSLRRELHILRGQLNRTQNPILLCHRDRVRLDLEQVRIDTRTGEALEDSDGVVVREFLEGLDVPGEDGFEDWLRRQRSALQGVGAARATGGAARRPEAPLKSDPGQGVVLAVLPFDSSATDAETTFFSDGVSEEILHTIARTADLKVINRGSSFQFRGRDKAVARVAAELGATHVLDGSIYRRGDQVRITASLVETTNQTIAWTARYDRALSDLFAVQDEIAATVAGALRLVFAPAERSRGIDAPTYEDFLRARSLALTLPETGTAIDLLRSVVGRAPGFAAGWATLALALATAAREQRDREAFAAAREAVIDAAKRAMALDDGAAVPFVAQSLVEPYRAFALREALLNQALAIAPMDSLVLKHAADFEACVGRLREAHRLAQRAREMDPLDPSIAIAIADLTGDLGKVSEAYSAYEALRARWPHFGWAVFAPLLVAANRGEWDVVAPLERLTQGFADVEGDYQEHAKIALNSTRLLKPDRDVDTRRTALAEGVERQLKRFGSVDLNRPGFLFNAGLPDLAFSAIERSDFRAGRGGPVEPVFLDRVIFSIVNAPMRADARFVQFCGQLGLCDYWVTSGRWPDCAETEAYDYDFKAEACAYVERRRLA